MATELNSTVLESTNSPVRLVCGKCEQSISPKRYPNPIICPVCHVAYHGKDCCGLEYTSWTGSGPGFRNKWKCPSCRPVAGYSGRGRPPKHSSQQNSQDSGNGGSKTSTDLSVPVATSQLIAASRSNTVLTVTQLAALVSQSAADRNKQSVLSSNPSVTHLNDQPVISPSVHTPVHISDEQLSKTQALIDEVNATNALAMSTPVANDRKRQRFNDSEESVDDEFNRLGVQLGLEVLADSDQTPGIRNLNRMVEHLVKTLSQVSRQLQGVTDELAKYKDEAKELRAENIALKQANVQLRKQLNESDTKIKDHRRAGEYRQRMSDNYSRVNNLVLHGAPKITPDRTNRNQAQAQAQVEADTLSALVDFCSEIGVTVSAADLDICHPLPSRGDKHKLIYRFLRRTKKFEILRAAKRVKLTSGRLRWADPVRNVFVTEHISPDSARLLSYAKSKLSAGAGGPFQYVWAKAGRIMAGNGSREQTFEVRWTEDVDDLLIEYGGARRNEPMEHSFDGDDQGDANAVTQHHRQQQIQ